MTSLRDAAAGCSQGIGPVPGEIPGLVHALLDPAEPDESKKAFLLALTRKGETAAELAGFAAAILPRAKDPGFQGEWNGRLLFDCCGTGGGGLNIINFSTALMFVLAGAGVPVVKHGNRGLTKTSGSADALEALGVPIDLAPDRLKACLEKTGMAFIFAPAYHGSFRIIAPVRKEIAAEGHRTIFNLLGPLLNPCRPGSQLTGVFRREHLDLFAEALGLLGRSRYRVLYGETDGEQALGEASPRGKTFWRDPGGPERIGLEDAASSAAAPEEWASLQVSSAKESAERIVSLLEGEGPPLARRMLRLNAAHAFCAQGAAASLEEGSALADESIGSGAAKKRLELWQSF